MPKFRNAFYGREFVDDDGQPQSCGECRFFGISESNATVCRRFPPVAAEKLQYVCEEGEKQELDKTSGFGLWPLVAFADVCGEFVRVQRRKPDVA